MINMLFNLRMYYQKMATSAPIDRELRSVPDFSTKIEVAQ